MNQRKRTDAQILKEKAKLKRKKERFITIRMWVSFLASKLFRDRGNIPSNIGNNIFIGNNQMITKNSLTVLLAITYFSDIVPTGFFGYFINEVKKYAKNIKIDITIKTSPYKFDPDDDGLKGRIHHWKTSMDSPKFSEDEKAKCARLLYSAEVLQNGNRGYSTIVYIMIRSNKGSDLNQGLREAKRLLNSYGILWKEIRNDLRVHLNYSLIISNKFDDKLYDFPATLQTSRTLAELLPVTQGTNDKEGVMFGFDNMNNTPYLINLKKYSEGKSILVTGQSGRGKTFLVNYVIQDMHNACDFNLCITDLKGNEFTHTTRSVGGVVLSMRENDPYYINPYVLPINIPDNRGALDLFLSKTALGKEYLKIIINPNNDEVSMTETMVNDFIANMYMSIGVTPSNVNSWSRSRVLTPYLVAEKFLMFMGHEQRERFGSLALRAIDRVRSYMYKDSPLSSIWRKELLIDDILSSSCLTFDYGMLDTIQSYDETIFKLKFAQAEYIKDVYIASKKKLGEWTAVVNEEAQLATDYVAAAYKKDVTMRRAQNCVIFVLCNSIITLKQSGDFGAVLGNIKIHIIGNITKTDRDFMLQEYDVYKYENVLKNIAENEAYYRSLLMINKLQPNAPTPILQVYLPEHVASGKLFRTVDTKS